MTHIYSSVLPLDPADERRRALAKVYSLLIRLAEEAEKDDLTSKVANTQAVKPASLPTGTQKAQ